MLAGYALESILGVHSILYRKIKLFFAVNCYLLIALNERPQWLVPTNGNFLRQFKMWQHAVLGLVSRRHNFLVLNIGEFLLRCEILLESIEEALTIASTGILCDLLLRSETWRLHQAIAGTSAILRHSYQLDVKYVPHLQGVLDLSTITNDLVWIELVALEELDGVPVQEFALFDIKAPLTWAETVLNLILYPSTSAAMVHDLLRRWGCRRVGKEYLVRFFPFLLVGLKHGWNLLRDSGGLLARTMVLTVK